MGHYRCDYPMRWSDMDAYGHVNNVQYLRFFEDARIEAFGAHRAGEGVWTDERQGIARRFAH